MDWMLLLYIVAGSVGTVVAIMGIAYITKKYHINPDQSIGTIKEAVDLASILINALKTNPDQVTTLEIIKEVVEIAVYEVEQLYIIGQMSKEEKKSAAIAKTKQLLENVGIEVDDNRLVLISALIEMTVYLMNKYMPTSII